MVTPEPESEPESDYRTNIQNCIKLLNIAYNLDPIEPTTFFVTSAASDILDDIIYRLGEKQTDMVRQSMLDTTSGTG